MAHVLALTLIPVPDAGLLFGPIEPDIGSSRSAGPMRAAVLGGTRGQVEAELRAERPQLFGGDPVAMRTNGARLHPTDWKQSLLRLDASFGRAIWCYLAAVPQPWLDLAGDPGAAGDWHRGRIDGLRSPTHLESWDRGLLPPPEDDWIRLPLSAPWRVPAHSATFLYVRGTEGAWGPRLLAWSAETVVTALEPERVLEARAPVPRAP